MWQCKNPSAYSLSVWGQVNDLDREVVWARSIPQSQFSHYDGLEFIALLLLLQRGQLQSFFLWPSTEYDGSTLFILGMYTGNCFVFRNAMVRCKYYLIGMSFFHFLWPKTMYILLFHSRECSKAIHIFPPKK